jgi:carboxyl-terminal processing protease
VRRYERLLRAMQALNTNDVLEIYLDALAHVYDPHSDYFGHTESQNFNIEMGSSLVGIGGTLEVKRGYCVIGELVPGGPAARSGLLKPGDRIVAVAQGGGEPVNVMGMPSMQVVALLRGPKGSTVRLTIIPKGVGNFTRKTVSLVRDEIKLVDEHAKAARIDLPQTTGPSLRIGILDLPVFYGKSDAKAAGASADIASLVKNLKQEGVQGLILDLRRNLGGSLEEAVGLTGLFIPAGPVVQMLNQDKDVEIGVSPETNALYDGPLVVLTSKFSASASEIVAGALQDYGRALIVGDSSTFGKGTIQNVVPLREFFHQRGLGSVNVTIGKFYRPSGASTQLKGVIPDIVLPSETDLPDIGESKLPNALPWDILPPTTYTKLDLVGSVLPGLREKSKARIAADPGFRLVSQELAMAESNEKAKSLTLNEIERRRAKTQADAIRADMEKAVLIANSDSPQLSMVKAEEVNPGAEIELREAENILSDYIRSTHPH